MSTASFQGFIQKTAAKGRISFGDVRRIQRDVLPDGITSRDEAEALLALDRRAQKVDAAWTDWLVASFVEYVVWAERPTGYVEAEKAIWITNLLEAGGRPTKIARRIAREIVREAQSSDEALVAFAMTGSDAVPATLEGASLAA